MGIVYNTDRVESSGINEGTQLKLPGEHTMVVIGLSDAIHEEFEPQCRPQSGLAAKHGIGTVNAPGTIDGDYRGKSEAILVKQGAIRVQNSTGDRVVQLVLAPVVRAQVLEVLDFDAREGGDYGLCSPRQ